MAEYKPKHDDQLAGDAKANMPHPNKEPKPHGDKLQDAVDEAAKKPREKH
jgi:hypothetical protein